MLILSYSDILDICMDITDFAQRSAFLLDEDAVILKVNTLLKQELVYSATERYAPSDIFEMAPSMTQSDWQHIQLELQENKSYTLQTELITKYGIYYPVTIYFKLQDIQDRPTIFCWLNAASDSKPSSSRQHQLLQISYYATHHANLMIFRLNKEGFFLDTNEVMEIKLGYQEEILKTKHVFELFSKGSLEDFKANWQLLLPGTPIYGEAIVNGNNGIPFPIEYYVSPMGKNATNGYCGIWTDISERKNKEKELQQAFDEIKELKDQLESDKQVLQEEIKLEYNFNNIIAKSPAYKKVLKQVEQVSGTDTPVLIYGETGTGKELLARTLHQISPRTERPLVKVNCSVMPPHMLEAELFGYEKGAFAGAFQQKKGRLEKAHQGTIFLDEIAELTLDIQKKLILVLQEGTFERMAGTESIQIDVRIIAATSRNLDQLVREGKFRQDLFYRLNIFPIHNLPLRERREDIPLLVRHFTEKYAYQLGKPITSIPQKALDQLLEYDFPGNVRELENIIERAVILSTGTVLNLQAPALTSAAANHGDVLANFKTMEEMQREYILEALRLSGGQISGDNGAAKLLGMNDKTLYSKMKKLKIERMDYL